MANLIELTNDRVQKGTFFWAPNQDMAQESRVGSQIKRPHLVLNVIDNKAICCPLSSSSDAWNATVSPHHIPHIINPDFFRGNDSLYSVNRIVKARKYPTFDLSFVEDRPRLVLPMPFVTMARQLEAAFASDYKARLIKVYRTHNGKNYKDVRLSDSVRRVDLVTEDIMHDLFRV